MKYAIIIAAAIALTGCAKQAEQSQAAGSEFVVDTLFTVNNCTVHRFSDAGRYVYFTNCEGSTSYSHLEQCGKTPCSRNKEVITNKR